MEQLLLFMFSFVAAGLRYMCFISYRKKNANNWRLKCDENLMDLALSLWKNRFAARRAAH